MGLIVDSNVFSDFERRGVSIDLSPWKSSDEIFISAVTVSELLMGVHRANNDERRKRRSKFVEAIIANVPVLDFTTAVAKKHARIYAELAQQGQMIGAHDLIIAATALHNGFSLLRANYDEFSRVSGLTVIRFQPKA